MQSGSVHIREDDVREVLDTLVAPSNDLKQTNALLSLAIVDDYLQFTDNLRMRYPRVYALQAVIADIIRDQLMFHRQSLNLPFDPEEPHLQANDSILRDYKTESTELIGWSLLYYCYVRVNLNLTLKVVSNLLHLVPRTLRRYRQHAIRRLTEIIIFNELQSRSRSRLRRLRSQFPPLPQTRIIGRETEFARLEHYFDHQRHGLVLITGMRGIGKTTLLQHFINAQIEKDERIDHVLWINRPQSQEVLQRAVDELTSPREGAFRSFCYTFNVVVVIDDADALITDLKEIRARFGHCLLLMSSSVQSSSYASDLHITLPELDMAQSVALIQGIHANSAELENLVSPAYLKPMLQVAGGNPMALRLVSQLFANGNFALPNSNIFDDLIEQIYRQISDESKRLWHALAICHPIEIDIEILLTIWRDSFKKDAVNELIDWHLLTLDSLAKRQFSFPGAAAHFIRYRYMIEHDESINIITSLLNELDVRLQMPQILELIDLILAQEWLEISADRQRTWVEGLLETEKNASIWYRVLRRTYNGSLHPENALLNLEYCRMLKATGQWQRAESGLDYVLTQTGMQSLFDIQVQAMIEYSALLRRRGAYTQAFSFLRRAYTIAEHRDWKVLAQEILLEQAQNAIDMRDADMALEQLKLVPETLRRLLLEAEAYLLRADYEKTYDRCHRGLEIAGNNRRILAHLHTLLGRTDEARGNYKDAIQQLTTAVNYYDDREDLFGLARCWSNLGAVTMRLGHVSEARQHLIKAQRIQEALGDKLGLAVTRYNLSLMRQSY